MAFPEHTNMASEARRKGTGVIGLVIGVAGLLSIAYWIFVSYVHARSEGAGVASRLLAWNPALIAERAAFVAIMAVYAGFIVGTLRKARRKEDQAVRAANLKSLVVTEGIQELILMHDRNLTALWANRAAGDSIGMKPQHIVGRHCYELWHQRSEPCVVCPVIRAMETGVQAENDVFTPDGRAFYIKGYPVRDEKGNVTGAIEVTLDITARKRAEDALAREKEHLAITLASIGDGVIVTDTIGTITFINAAAEKLTGWRQSDAFGQQLEHVFTLIHAETRMPYENPLEAVRRISVPASLPTGAILLSRDGTERLIAASGAPIKGPDGKTIGMIIVFRDVTEKHRLEEEIIKSQKLESIGVLAGGIAHDFNNFLTAIIGNASLARLSMSAQDKSYGVLSDIEKAATRARKLTQQLLTFSKGGSPVKRITPLGDTIRDTVSFALTGSNVSSTFDMPDDLSPVDADTDQISHAVNNIVINAREAMPHGGTISIRAENVDVAEGAMLPLPPQRYVKISIQDRGVGIPRDDVGKIFDPYFTTKAEQHSGLGLSVAYFVVKKHGGHITVDSEPDVATIFSIYLPAARAELPAAERKEPAAPTRGHGRILVMDDEEIVRDVLGKILQRFGYDVEFARDGMEAVDVYRAAIDSAKPFDAVIMDLTITGGMGGIEAIELLRLIDPDAKAIVSSGYSDDPVMSDFRKYGFDGVIAKPFRAEELSAALGKILSREKVPSRKDRASG